jgi:glycosyltransferase involved in cell wall biosynthesis
MNQMFHIHHNAMPFDVIFVQGAHVPAGLALELQEETGVPVVIRTHGEDIQIDRESDYGYRLNPEKNKLILSNLNRADCNIAIGPHVYEELSTLCDPSKTTLIFNGVNTDLFYPAESNYLRASLGINQNQFVLLTVGRNVKKKSLHYAIEVLSLLRNRGLDVVLVHVGKEGNGTNLKDEATRCNIAKSFYQLGKMDYFDLPEIYRSADLFIFPSKTETFGNVTIEAMACGLPCIEFDYIVNQHKIEHGVTGYILPYGDFNAMADAVQELIENPEKKHQFAHAGLDKIQDQFSWKSVTEQYMKIFHWVSNTERNQLKGASSATCLHAASDDRHFAV